MMKKLIEVPLKDAFMRVLNGCGENISVSDSLTVVTESPGEAFDVREN